jgi:hypothetical protein
VRHQLQLHLRGLFQSLCAYYCLLFRVAIVSLATMPDAQTFLLPHRVPHSEHNSGYHGNVPFKERTDQPNPFLDAFAKLRDVSVCPLARASAARI